MSSAPLSSNELASQRTELARKRTLMAADRSLMAWLRTSLSMTSFGFTIYKVLQGFQKSSTAFDVDISPRAIGLFLIGLGIVAMVTGSVEYWLRLEDLRKFQPFKIVQPTFVMAMVMSVTGVVLFIGIVSKLL